MMVRVPDLSGAFACRVPGDEGNMAVGGYFGRYMKPSGVKAHHRDRRFFRNQRGRHRVVLASQGARPELRFRKVSIRISQAASFTRARIAKETVLHADEAASWDNGHERFEIERSNHQEAYRLDGARADLAEEYFSRLRRPAIAIPQPGAGAHR